MRDSEFLLFTGQVSTHLGTAVPHPGATRHWTPGEAFSVLATLLGKLHHLHRTAEEAGSRYRKWWAWSHGKQKKSLGPGPICPLQFFNCPRQPRSE